MLRNNSKRLRDLLIQIASQPQVKVKSSPSLAITNRKDQREEMMIVEETMIEDAKVEKSADQGPGLIRDANKRAGSQVMRKETEKEREMAEKVAEAIIIIEMTIVRISISIVIITMIHIGVRIAARDTERMKAEEIEVSPGLLEENLLRMETGMKEEGVKREAD